MGTPRTDYRARQRLAQRLRALGVAAPEVARQVQRLQQRQDAARRAGVTLGDFDAVIERTHDELRLDDAGYRPAGGDPLLRGPARATGATARAVRRRSRALTRYEHEQAVGT